MNSLNPKTLGRDLVELLLLSLALVAVLAGLQGEPDFLRIPLLLALALTIPSLAGAAVKFYRDLQDGLDDDHHHA